MRCDANGLLARVSLDSWVLGDRLSNQTRRKDASPAARSNCCKQLATGVEDQITGFPPARE